MFRSRVQLVAIDECHVIRQWKGFRPEYLQFHALRRTLSPSATFFACTATFDRDTEVAVLQNGGFRPYGPDTLGHLDIIRTSIDRPEIAIGIMPIEPKKQTSYEQLLGCLDKAFSDEGSEPTQHRIPKTILFVDGRARISRVASMLKQHLISKGYSPTLAYNTIGVYTARVAPSD